MQAAHVNVAEEPDLLAELEVSNIPTLSTPPPDPAEEEQAPTEGLAQQQVEPPVAATTANTSQRFVPYRRTLLGAAGIAARDARSSQVC